MVERVPGFCSKALVETGSIIILMAMAITIELAETNSVLYVIGDSLCTDLIPNYTKYIIQYSRFGCDILLFHGNGYTM